MNMNMNALNAYLTFVSLELTWDEVDYEPALAPFNSAHNSIKPT